MSLGPNINISKVTGTMTEPTIVINPVNSNLLFAASNWQNGSAPANGIYTAYSTNGGVNWTKGTDFASPPFATPCCDSIGRSDGAGNLFVSYLGSTGPNNLAVIVKSTDFGQNFVPLSSFNGDDQPHLATGELKPSGDHLTWMCWVGATGINIAGGRYTTIGSLSSLTAVTAVAPGSNVGNFGDISISDDGTVMIVYQDQPGSDGPSNLYINTINGSNPSAGLVWNPQINIGSTNVGSIWGNPQFPNAPTNPSLAFPPQKLRSIDAGVKLDWDRSGGIHNGRVYCAYSDASDPKASPGASSMNIKVIYSDNKGLNWSTPKIINDVSANARFFSRIMVDQITGNVGVSWYDARNSNTNDKFQSYCAFSFDGGNNWSNPNILVSSGGLSDGNTVNPNDTGDFSDCTFNNNLFYPIWTDNSPNCPNYTNGTPGPTGGMNILTAKILLCLHPNTLILLPDGSQKRIIDLKRGDYVAADPERSKKYRISRVTIASYFPERNMNIVVFEKNSLGENIPSEKTIMTEGHPIFYKGKRRSSLAFKNFDNVTFYQGIEAKKLFEVSKRGSIDLYDLQFDNDGSYVANGIQVQSRSPWSIVTPLPKHLYIDVKNYSEERTTDSLKHEISRDWNIMEKSYQKGEVF